MEAYHQGFGYKLAAFAHQKFKTHRSLPENRMDEIIADMKAAKISMDAPVATAAGGVDVMDHAALVADDVDDDDGEENDDAGIVEYWAMCKDCTKYRKLCNPFFRMKSLRVITQIAMLCVHSIVTAIQTARKSARALIAFLGLDDINTTCTVYGRRNVC